MPRQPTMSRLQLSGHRFLLRRIECALLRRDIHTVNQPLRGQSVSLAVGCVLAAAAVAGSACVALLRPHPQLDHAQLVMGQESGALYVRVGDTWHPVLNLVSARLIAATNANPQRVPEAELGRTKRGPLLGIPGAPQVVGEPLSSAESGWTICDNDGGTVTTVVTGRVTDAPLRRLEPDQTVLVAAGSRAPAYLLYNGRRALVELAESAVVRALRLEDSAPQVVSQLLLNAILEVPPITVPRIRGTGGRTGGLRDFPVGSVLRITRGDGDEYYVVLPNGVQRIGPVAADLLRLGDSQGAANVVAVAPDVIRDAPIVNTLPVSTFPDRVSAPLDSGSTGTICVNWTLASSGGADISFLVGSGLPVPAGHTPVRLAQADGHGPALDAVYLPPGRSAYVRATGLSGDTRAGTRYVITDTGVRFAIHDDDVAHDLGLSQPPIPAPWSMLAALPCGPELSREKALVAWDVGAVEPS